MLSRNKTILSGRDKNRVREFLMHERSLRVISKPSHHKYLWLKCSGAWNRLHSNPGYYDALKHSNIVYPSPIPAEIEKDMRRTFGCTGDPNQVEKDINAMRNVLVASGLRNPTVGYC